MSRRNSYRLRRWCWAAGGGWVEGLYDTWVWALTPFLEAGGQLIILPCSVSGYQGFFRRFGSQITLFARERNTLQQLEAVEELRGRLHLAHDLAFGLDVSRFAAKAGSAGSGVGLLMRTDGERRQGATKFGNLDIALAKNGLQWVTPELCQNVLEPVASLMGLYSTIVTDRLHMSVLAALIGRRVEMVANNYHKNSGVFGHSLNRFPNVRFHLEQEAFIGV